jgi:hypothetical protein
VTYSLGFYYGDEEQTNCEYRRFLELLPGRHPLAFVPDYFDKGSGRYLLRTTAEPFVLVVSAEAG